MGWLYVWALAGLIMEAVLEMNWSNFVDELVFYRNNFLWEVLGSGTLLHLQNKFCWIYDNMALAAPLSISVLWVQYDYIRQNLHHSYI